MPFYFLPGKSQSGLDIPLNQELIEKGELLFLLSLLLCSFIAFFILLLHLCDQLQRNTTSLWCSAQMTAVCSTASGSPSWTGSSPAVDREALPQSQWWSPVSGRAQRRWVCAVTEAFDRFGFFSLLFCLQVVCPLPLLGCLHGGGWWDFLWIQRWCYRYNQHERGGPAPDCCVRKLRQVWISLKLTVFTSGCVQREVFVLCFCFIIHILQTKPIYTFFSFLIFVSIFQATKMIPYLDTVSDYIYGISAQALKWAVKLRPRWKNVKTLCRPEVFWKRQT